MSCRRARPDDAPRLSELVSVLGYALEEEDARRRIEGLATDPRHALFVLERDANVVGFGHCASLESFIGGPFAVLAALCVDPGARRSGVARELLEQAEGWAREQGLGRIVVRSRVERAEAHAFYLSCGYARTKEQAVFAKTLDAST